MWPETFEFIRNMIAVICCAASVKLSDDFLDYNLDLRTGRYNWTKTLQSGTMFYAILLLIAAAGLNAVLTMPLFLASYIIGMFSDMKSRFPSSLTGLQESLIVFVFGVILFSFNSMVFSLLFISAVQLLDDCLDIVTDQLAGYRNLACRFGCVECMILAAICLVFAWIINESNFFPIFCGTIFLYLVICYKEAHHDPL